MVAKAYSGDRAQAQGLVPDARNAVCFPVPALARGYAADDMYVKADARMSPARVVWRKLSAATVLPPIVRCAKPPWARPWNESDLWQGAIFASVCSSLAAGGSGRAFRAGLGRRRVRSPMNELLLDYLPLVIFIAVALAISLVLLVVPFVIAYQAPDPEKLSAYECGFNAFDDARMRFDVRFYLVAILFIIFDLEMSFLFPWAVSLGDLGLYGYWSMMVFLGVLTVGFIYEWRKGALEWD
jgi:NADH-quinone oxidoreductase subunit A